MFEKYTEKARRVIFFARYEVSEFGSKSIEPEHLLLGLLREDEPLVTRFLPANISSEMIREQVESHMPRGERIATSVEIPLSPTAKDVLKYAHEESENLKHRHIGTEHLLLGLLQRKGSATEQVLRESGLALAEIRQQIKGDAKKE
jgi:ATP-dependent Clp protease ATP-binding subunit ClpC